MSSCIYNNSRRLLKKIKVCSKTSFNKNNNKTIFVLLFKKQYYYLQTKHSYHLVDSSPGPFFGGWGLFLTKGTIFLLSFFIYKNINENNNRI